VLTGAEQPRLSQIVYDTAGRVGETKFGQGTADGFDHIFAKTSYAFGSADSELPVIVDVDALHLNGDSAVLLFPDVDVGLAEDHEEVPAPVFVRNSSPLTRSGVLFR
jgi:hypothetical protein